jgi:hypothetical protein
MESGSNATLWLLKAASLRAARLRGWVRLQPCVGTLVGSLTLRGEGHHRKLLLNMSSSNLFRSCIVDINNIIVKEHYIICVVIIDDIYFNF